MEAKELFPFVILLVLVGMVIGVGILVLDKTGAATYYKRTGYNDSVAILNYTGQALDWGNISNYAVYNHTTALLPSACYDINTTKGQFMYKNETTACDVIGAATFFIIYDYKDYATETAKATRAASNAVGDIASDWIGLIVTIFVLSIILFFVVRSFRPGGR